MTPHELAEAMEQGAVVLTNEDMHAVTDDDERLAALLRAGAQAMPSAPPRECVGTFVYPDSAGHCVPKETTR